MSDIPWWGLPLVAGMCVAGGVLVGYLLSAGARRSRARTRRHRQWYTERTSAYVALLAAFDRSVARMRLGFASGVTEPDLLVYLNEIGPALTQVRLVASPRVRNAALAVHRVLEDMHGQRPAAEQNGKARAFLEMLNHVPLVVHELERAIRDELGIDLAPRPPGVVAGPDWRVRVRAVTAGLRRPNGLRRPAAATDEAPPARSDGSDGS